MLKIIPIPIFDDNYVWCLTKDSQALVVDPGSFKEVNQYIEQNNLILEAILITHHHPDHTGGVNELKQTYPNTKVYGPSNSPFKQIEETLKENDIIEPIQGVQFSILETPAHTLDHIVFYHQPSDLMGNFAFTGDTLFSAGCGRLFEGDALMLLSAMNKLLQLPDNTEIYCTHEYTLSNLKFAKSVEPNNTYIDTHIKKVEDLRAQGIPSLPTDLKLEKTINPFLRWQAPDIIKNISDQFKLTVKSDLEVLKAIRQWKDNF